MRFVILNRADAADLLTRQHRAIRQTLACITRLTGPARIQFAGAPE